MDKEGNEIIANEDEANVMCEKGCVVQARRIFRGERKASGLKEKTKCRKSHKLTLSVIFNKQPYSTLGNLNR